MGKYKLTFKRFTYVKDIYGQTKIYIDKDSEYDKGSKALRYLLDYIEALETSFSKEELSVIRKDTVNKKYKTKPIQKLISEWRDVIDNS